MATDEKAEWIDFARQLAGLTLSAPEVRFNFIDHAPVREKPTLPSASEKGNAILETPPAVSKAQQEAIPADLSNKQAPQLIEPETARRKQLRTPNEIAKMIAATLSAIESSPARGLVVTVYGSNPWNAMLTIRPEAGIGIDRALWISRVEEISMQLREDFDVLHEAKAISPEVTDLAGPAGR